MRTRTRGIWANYVVAASMAALLAGPLATGEAWAGKRSKLKATINDAKFKTNKRATATAAVWEPATDRLTIAGGRGKARGRGPDAQVDVVVLEITATVDLDAVTPPVTIPADVSVVHTVTRGPVPETSEIWTGEKSVELTITRFAGGRIKVTFEGTADPAAGTSAPAAITGGKGSLLVNQPEALTR